MSADAGSIPTEDDESASIHSQSSESVNDDDDSSTSDVSDASRGSGSYEESILHSNHYEESEDDEYSDELEESEDELEFDDESEDGGGRRKRGSNKDAHVVILSDTDAVSAEKQVRSKAHKVGAKKRGQKSSGQKDDTDESSVEKETKTKPELAATTATKDEGSTNSQHCDSNQESDDEYENENSCDKKDQTPEMKFYISTLQHTQIQTTKTSLRRITHAASTAEPTALQVLSVVDQLFQMIQDINSVTVRDIVHSVAEHFGLSRVKKEMRGAIKERLTELIYAQAAGVEVAPSMERGGMKQDGAKKQKGTVESDGVDEPRDSEVIDFVDQLFEAVDNDTVFFTDIIRDVESHFGLVKVKKETKRLIKARFIELMNATESIESESKEQNDVREAAEVEYATVKEDSADNQEMNETFGNTSGTSFDTHKNLDNMHATTDTPEEASISFFDGGDVSFEIDVYCENNQLVPTEEDIPNKSSVSSVENPDPFVDFLAREQLINETSDPSNCNGKEIDSSFRNDIHTPQIEKNMKGPNSLIASADSRDKSLAGEYLKCNDSFMSCETTMFNNLSPECAKPKANKSMDNLMGSLSISDSLSSTNETRRVEKGKWSLGKEIGSGSFGVVHFGMNAVDGSEYET
jgi:hypothetical protein